MMLIVSIAPRRQSGVWEQLEVSKRKRKSVQNPQKELARELTRLIDTLGNGSQRQFAERVGCSQSVLSRVINGQSRPGPDLLDRIGRLPGVDTRKLRALAEAESRGGRDEVVPLLDALQAGPVEHTSSTGHYLTIPVSISRPGMYAVRADACQPAFADHREQFLPDDLILIDTDRTRFKQNVQLLNERLCVVHQTAGNFGAITLQRIKVVGGSRPALRLDKPESSVRAAAAPVPGERKARIITLPQEAIAPNEKTTAETTKPSSSSDHANDVELKSIVGLAIQAIRRL